MPEEQVGFFFDAPLSADVEPASQIVLRPVAPPVTDDFAERIWKAAEAMPTDEFSMEDILDAVGISQYSRIAAHRSKVLSVLLSPGSGYGSYLTEPDKRNQRDLRFVRRAPLEPCTDCGKPAPSGRLCVACTIKEDLAIDAADEERLNVE
ncbi:unnamed protein product [Sphagnum balticum]